MTLSRRNLLKSGAILSATGLLPPSAAAQAQQELPKAFQALRPLGDRVKPITPDEFRARVARAQKLMTDSNPQISALYLTPGTSLYYFSGIRWGISERLLARNDQREKPLADPPANAGEVVQRGAWREIERRDLRVAVGHQLLRPGNARAKFVRRDGLDAISERPQRLERFGEFLLSLRRCGRRQQPSRRKDCSAFEEVAARKSHGTPTALFHFYGNGEL